MENHGGFPAHRMFEDNRQKGGNAMQPEIKKPEKKRVKVRIGKGSCSICD